MNQSVTNRQQFMIIYTALTTFYISMIPQILAINAGPGGWVSILIAGGVFCIFMLIIGYLSNKYEGKTLYCYSHQILGKFLGKIVAVIYILYFILISCYLMWNLFGLVRENVLFLTPIWMIALTSLLVAGYCVFKGIRVTARVIEIFALISMVATIFLGILMIVQGKTTNILPLYVPAYLPNYLSKVPQFLSSFVGIEVLTSIPASSKNKNMGIRGVMAILFVSLVFVLSAEGSILMMGLNEAAINKHSYIAAVRLIEIPYIEFLRRVDIIYIVIVLTNIHAGIIIFFTATVEYTNRLFHKVKRDYVVIGIFFILLAGSLISRKFNYADIFEKFINYYALVTAGVIPLLILIVSIIKPKFRKIIFALATTCFILMTSGCWDLKNIEEKNIIITTILDKKEEYEFHVEIAKLGESADGETKGPKSILLSTKGKTINEAREAMNRKTNKELFLGATQAVIFTEDLAKEDILEYVFRLRQFREYRKTLKIAITKEKPMDILKAETENAKLIGFTIDETLQSLIDDGTCVYISLANLLDIVNSDYSCLIVPSISLDDNSVILNGYFVIYKGKSIGFIDAKDSEGLIYLLAKKPHGFVDIEYEGKGVLIETRVAKKKVTPTYIDGQAEFKIELSVDSFLLYPKSEFSISEDLMEKFNQNLEKELKKEVLKTINTSQEEFKVDYLECYDSFRVKYPVLIKKLDWDEIYTNAKFEVIVKSKMDKSSNFVYNNKPFK